MRQHAINARYPSIWFVVAGDARRPGSINAQNRVIATLVRVSLTNNHHTPIIIT